MCFAHVDYGSGVLPVLRRRELSGSLVVNLGNLSPRRLDLTKWRVPWSSWAGSDSGIFCISILRANSPFGLWRLFHLVHCFMLSIYSASFNCISGSWSVCISESLIFPFSFFLIISSLSSPLFFTLVIQKQQRKLNVTSK